TDLVSRHSRAAPLPRPARHLGSSGAGAGGRADGKRRRVDGADRLAAAWRCRRATAQCGDFADGRAGRRRRPAAEPAWSVCGMIAFDAALRTRDLAVGYRTRRARRAVLEHVSVTVDSGEFVCLLGPNGIGKSTLLRTIARIQPPLWGSVELGGADLRAVSHAELARRLGVVLT